jgi:hypothetical protein
MATLDELKAQQAALTRALALHELPLLEQAQANLAELAQSQAVAALGEIGANLPDSGIKSAVDNVRAAIDATAALIAANLPRVRELAAPPAQPSAGE